MRRGCGPHFKGTRDEEDVVGDEYGDEGWCEVIGKKEKRSKQKSAKENTYMHLKEGK